MRGISLWEPWASLVARAYKRIETRKWRTNHRGQLAIHSSARPFTKRTLREAEELLERAGVGANLLGDLRRLPFGKILAIADVEDCVPTDGGHGRIVGMQFHEWRFGDYSPGRWAWLLGNLARLAEPVPFRARQRLFRLPETVSSLFRLA